MFILNTKRNYLRTLKDSNLASIHEKYIFFLFIFCRKFIWLSSNFRSVECHFSFPLWIFHKISTYYLFLSAPFESMFFHPIFTLPLNLNKLRYYHADEKINILRGFNFANISRIEIELTFSNDFELNRKIKLDSLHRK